MLRDFLIAVQFITSFPVKIVGEIRPQDNARGLLFYPLIGLLIGLVLFLISLAIEPSDLGAAIVLFCWVFFTGALHLDGLADSADAWMGGHSDSERTLSIMKDPASGAIAVVTLILVMLMKWAAIKSILLTDAYLIIFSPIIARMMVVILMMTTPYVREYGLAADMKKYLSKKLSIYMLAGFSFILLFCNFKLAFLALFFGIATTFLLRHFMLRRINGFTGDTAGATIEIVELAVLVLMALIV